MFEFGVEHSIQYVGLNIECLYTYNRIATNWYPCSRLFCMNVILMLN